MSRRFQITVDCADPHRLAEWWADVLGWEVEPTDESFIRSMVEQGHASDDETTTYAGALVWKDGAAIAAPDADAESACARILFQAVPEPKTVKNRLHLDIDVGADRCAIEAERLVAAGATLLHHGQQGPQRWITLADPEGNEFCIT